MAVPQLALLGLEGRIKFWRDHVLDADEARARVGTVIKDALAHVLGQMAAVVVGFDVAGRVVSVDVEGVEVGANGFDGGEVLGTCISRVKVSL